MSDGFDVETTGSADKKNFVVAPRVVPATSAPLDMGDGPDITPSFALTSRFVTVDGNPWIPVMGEYHFSRDARDNWESELRKMKSGGIDILATYFFWILHEEVEGKIRWDGNLDARHFIELAAKVGLRVMIRIGPWAHGEARNGGFPDWLQARPINHRTDDPAYLAEARRWYSAIEEQLRGLFHSKDAPDAPIVGIQVDNELYDQPRHLATLRELAESVGMQASIWTATGWGGAQLPTGKVLPVYAGYSDGFWDESTTEWPAFGVMHFTFNTERDDLTVGADLRDKPLDAGTETDLGASDPWPYVTCELGGGMHVAYHRRPMIDPEDVSALALTKLGSGSSWQGYYLYHGVSQVIGELSSTQESHETDYPNDLPRKDYDFGAPLGAAGTERQHYHKLRLQHLFIQSFGSRFAHLPSTIPNQTQGEPRWAYRGDNQSGFVFFNNHQPAIAALSDLEGVQFTVAFDDRDVSVPPKPFTLKSGSHGVWPLRQPIGDIRCATISAQPITQIEVDGNSVVFFAETPGVDVYVELEDVQPNEIAGLDALSMNGTSVSGKLTSKAGVDSRVTVGNTTLVFLDTETAESLWRGEIAGRDHVLLWPGSGWFDTQGFRLENPSTNTILQSFPPLAAPGFAKLDSNDSLFSKYLIEGSNSQLELVAPTFTDPTVSEIRLGGSNNRYSAPSEMEWAELEPVDITVPLEAFEDVERLVLSIDWIGDAARLYSGETLVSDQFWFGGVWEVDLLPYLHEIQSNGLSLKAFAWRGKSPVYVDKRVRPNSQENLLIINRAWLKKIRSTSIS